MSFKDSPQPPAALHKTKALSVEENDASLLSDSVSVDSTVTLENLPLKPGRLQTPPWSTEDSSSCSGAGRALYSNLPVYSTEHFTDDVSLSFLSRPPPPPPVCL